MSIRELMQKRDALVVKMNDIVKAADEETRSLTSEESESFDSLEKELAELDKTIEAKRAIESLEVREKEEDEEPEAKEEESQEAAEERAFAEFVRSGEISTRTATNMTKGDNGAVVPQSIANKIIEKVEELCPIYADSEHFNVKGTLQLPYYDASTDDIKMEYADEFTDGESHSGKFLSISLTGFLGRAICDVSKSLINNSDFDIVNYVVNHMAKAIAKFIEKECLLGTASKIDGLSTIGADMTVTAASKTEITADELQDKVVDAYQDNAYWIMNRSTRTAIRQIKNGQGEYLLNMDLTSKWGYTLLGKPVYTSDNMPEIADGAKTIFYGDMSGLAVKLSEDINVDVLYEAKARQHAVEVLGFVEMDAKIQDAQKIAQLKMKA